MFKLKKLFNPECKTLIWSDLYFKESEYIKSEMEYIRDDLFRDCSDDERYQMIWDANELEFKNIEEVFESIKLPNGILGIADLGFWNGRRSGYNIKDTDNLKGCIDDALSTQNDFYRFYIDTKGNLRADSIHHDGCHHYIFRAIKEGVSDRVKKTLEYKLVNELITPEEITRYTFRVGPMIKKALSMD